MRNQKQDYNDDELELPFVDPESLEARQEELEDNDELPILASVRRADEKLLQLLISLGEDVDEADESSWTPLHQAAWLGNEESTKILLEAGADFGAETEQRDRPLHIAAMEDHQGIIELLLDRDAELEAENDIKLTPLILAVTNNSNAAAEVLINRGADFSVQDDRGASLLHHAADRNNSPLIRLLLEAGIPIDQRDGDGRTALHWASAGLCPSTVETLIAAGADVTAVDGQDNTVLHAAVGAYVLAGEIDPTMAILTPRILQELEDGSYRLVSLPENARAYRKFARRYGTTRRFPRDLPDNRRKPVYNYRYRQANRHLVDRLLEQESIDIEAENGDGLSAIQIADKAGFTDIVDILLAHGADPSGVDLLAHRGGFDPRTVSTLDALDALGAAINGRNLGALKTFVDQDVVIGVRGDATGEEGFQLLALPGEAQLLDYLGELLAGFPEKVWAELAGLEFGPEKNQRRACLVFSEGMPENLQAVVQVELRENQISRIIVDSIPGNEKFLRRTGLYPL